MHGLDRGQFFKSSQTKPLEFRWGLKVWIFLKSCFIRNAHLVSWPFPHNAFVQGIKVAFEIYTSIWQKKKKVNRFEQFLVEFCLKNLVSNSKLLKLLLIVIYRIDFRRWDQLFWNSCLISFLEPPSNIHKTGWFGQDFESCKQSFWANFNSKLLKLLLIVIYRIDYPRWD